MENEPIAPQAKVKLPNFWFCLIWPAVALVLVLWALRNPRDLHGEGEVQLDPSFQLKEGVKFYYNEKERYVVERPDVTPLHPFVPIAALLLVLGCAHWLWGVHRVHQVMEGTDYLHPVSSGDAVRFHLIPAYNLFWVLKWPREIAKSVNEFSNSSWMGESASGIILFLALLSQYTICFDIVQLWRSATGLSRGASSLAGLVTLAFMVRAVGLVLAIMVGAKISRHVGAMLSDPNPREWPPGREPC
ncbi:MAG: hypothetical protein ABSE56_06370 [Bryobacteraceae bacterium]